MKLFIVVSHASQWPFQIADVNVVPVRLYLTNPAYREPDAFVINLCESYDYQSRGYFVSMLAEARGQEVLPSRASLENVQPPAQFPPLDHRFQQLLSGIGTKRHELRIYFGQTHNPCYAPLGRHLFKMFGLPLLNASFHRDQMQWRLQNIQALTLNQVDPGELTALTDAAERFFKPYQTKRSIPATHRPKLAILRSPECPLLPSNPAAIQKFQEAAEILGMRPELITRDDGDRVHQFDGLFIRDTTNVHHYTYQVARRATAAGLIVMDDPDSILKCSNKIYMTELLGRYRVPMPKTMIVHRNTLGQVIPSLGLPCILKQPDGCFSLGVVKVESPDEILPKAETLFAHSELILAQEYVPTQFDWRIGILDRQPLFACRYFMAPGHWQVIKHHGHQSHEGLTESVAIGDTPQEVLEIAMQAANLIGDGLYGVDIKQRGRHSYVIEINDNPNVDAGNEDGVLKDDLYRSIMGVFKRRIEARRRHLP